MKLKAAVMRLLGCSERELIGLIVQRSKRDNAIALCFWAFSPVANRINEIIEVMSDGFSYAIITGEDIVRDCVKHNCECKRTIKVKAGVSRPEYLPKAARCGRVRSHPSSVAYHAEHEEYLRNQRSDNQCYATVLHHGASTEGCTYVWMNKNTVT